MIIRSEIRDPQVGLIAAEHTESVAELYQHILSAYRCGADLRTLRIFVDGAPRRDLETQVLQDVAINMGVRGPLIPALCGPPPYYRPDPDTVLISIRRA